MDKETIKELYKTGMMAFEEAAILLVMNKDIECAADARGFLNS